MKTSAYQILQITEFSDWREQQSAKSKLQIDERLVKIRDDGYFSDHKNVSNGNEVWELRWKNGKRLYFSYIPEKKVLLLLGGNKNGQDKDIRKVQTLFKRYTAQETSSRHKTKYGH